MTAAQRDGALAVMDRLIDRLPDPTHPANGPERELAEAGAEARAAVAELIGAIETDAVNRAINAGLGASEWRAFVPAHTAAALAKVQP